MSENGTKPARYAMVGGGDGAFIGGVHRAAARLDGRCDLVAGALSSDPERARRSGIDLGLDPTRAYPDWRKMLEVEAGLDPNLRSEFVAIVTPNHLHAPVALAALDAGFAVLCDKPLSLDVAEAEALSAKVEQTGALFGVTYNYSGYPMVREARARIRSGRLGPVRKVMVEYVQGWLARRIERDGQKQADWRTDPARAGAAGAMGDIGTHAAHLAEFVTGLRLTSVCADLAAVVEGRTLDDDGAVFLRFEAGVRGLLAATQIAVGRENGLRLRVFCEHGSLEWFQEEPNSLVLDVEDEPRRVLRTGGPDTGEDAACATRLPAGHPEGFLEAFANLYTDFGTAVQARRTEPSAVARWTPTVDDGLQGMRFVDALVRSDAAGQAWQDLGGDE